MTTVLITGSHPRHAAMARAIAASDTLDGLIVEEREAHVPTPPDNLSSELRNLFDLHFERRALAEERFFGTFGDLPDVPTLRITREELNSDAVLTWLKQRSPDLLISYGVHLLSAETLALAHGAAWNIHGGLSPWYRGTITHFWPSYMLQPQFTGMTLHETVASIDAGPLIHQSVAQLVRGDGLHDLACRAVDSLAVEIPRIIQKFHRGEPIEKKRQTTSGRIWRNSDWRPDHLRLVYQHFEDLIVDHYLNGYFQRQDPVLHRQF